MSIRLLAVAVVTVAVSALSFAPQAAFGEEPAAPPADVKMTLFLLVGQSNMAGRGIPEAEDKVPFPRVWSFNADGKWVPAVDPIHFDKPKVAGVGMGRTFGKTIADAMPDAQIGLIPCAFGGTSIEEWKVGGKLYTEAVRRAKLAQANGTIAGILWHQGESNSNAKGISTYADKLDAVMSGFRHDLDAPSAPLIVGKLGQFRIEKAPYTVQFNALLEQYAKDHPNTACVETDGLTSIGDNTHFDAKSQREFGKRYAEAYLKLVGTRATTRPAAEK